MRALSRHVIGNQLPLLTIGGGLFVVLYLLITVIGGVADSVAQRRSTRSLVARALAEELALSVVVEDSGRIERFGYIATGRTLAAEAGERLEIEVLDPKGRVHHFGGDRLQGSAPPAFGNALSILRRARSDRDRGHDWQWLERAPDPEWLGALPEVSEVDCDRDPGMNGVIADSSMALMRLASGTDCEDFVLVRDPDEVCRPLVPGSGVMTVRGNLWLVSDSGRIDIELDAPLTLVVEGNVYVDANLRVLGGHPLFLCVREVAGSRYVDIDLDGRFSAADRSVEEGEYQGFQEGSGMFHLGLPGCTGREEFWVQANLYVEGALCLRGAACRFDASVTLGSGLQLGRPDAELEFSGERLPAVHRRRVPGFRVRGGPRPGVLQAFSVLEPSNQGASG